MTDSKQKYDWPKLKEEYFLSDFLEVKSFFEDKFRTYTGHIRKKTNGWAKEKRDFARSILSQSVEICKEKRSVEMAESLENVLQELQGHITAYTKDNLSIRERKYLWEIFMTMNDQSTRVVPNNTFGVPLRNSPDDLTEEERRGIEKTTDYIYLKKIDLLLNSLLYTTLKYGIIPE